MTICVVLLLNLMRYIQKEFNTKNDNETIKFINKMHIGYHEIDYLPSAISCDNNGTTTFLLICIPSATGNFKQRLAIRNSWGSAVKRNPSLTLTFFVEKSKNKETENIVRKEKQIFRDIIEVDVEARYENLAKKSIMILE